MDVIQRFIKSRSFYSVTLSVIISVVFVAVAASAATTISTNITTGGNVTVSGHIFATSTVAVTGLASFYDQLVLDNASSDPTGAAAGAIYWDTANEVIRVFDGGVWNTVASSTDSSGGLILSQGIGVRFNDIATNYMALGTSTLPVINVDAGNAILHLNATTSNSVPLVIVGHGGYGGNLLNVYDYLEAEVFSIDAIGNASSTMLSTTAIQADALVVSGYATTSGSTGNFATEGTLEVTGATTLTGALTANGAVTLGNAVTDAITITGAATTTNAFNVGGVFSVDGYATTTVNLTDTTATTTIGRNTEAGGGAALGVGTTTPSYSAALGVVGSIHAGTTGTTTLSLHTNAAADAGGSCIQMVASDGTMIRIYATSTPGDQASGKHFPLLVETGACVDGGS